MSSVVVVAVAVGLRQVIKKEHGDPRQLETIKRSGFPRSVKNLIHNHSACAILSSHRIAQRMMKLIPEPGQA